MAPKKLIDKYQIEVKNIEELLWNISNRISQVISNSLYKQLLEERRELNEKKKIYSQFIKDLEDL